MTNYECIAVIFIRHSSFVILISIKEKSDSRFMPAYIYKATTLEGKTMEGTMEAADSRIRPNRVIAILRKQKGMGAIA